VSKEIGVRCIIISMMKKIIFVIFIICLQSTPVFSETLDFKTFKSSELIIKYEKPLEPVVKNVAALYPQVKSALEMKLNLEVSFQPTVFLISNASAFRRMANGNELITAFAIPKRNAMVIDYSKMERNPFDLKLTIQHELCHLILHQYIRRELLPKWLNEGISQWVSEGVADIIHFDRNKTLKQAVLSNRLLSLNDISVHFPRSDNLFTLSYEESRSVVE
jgi:hypothetical protein